MNWLFGRSASAALYGIIQRHSLAIIWLTCGVTLLFLLSLPKLRFENQPGQLDLPAGDPLRVELDAFRSQFSSGEAIIVGMELGRPIAAVDVELIQTLTDRLAGVQGVHFVHSLANGSGFAWTPSLGFAQLRVRPLLPKSGRAGDSAITALLRSLGSNPLCRDNLISSDGRQIAFVLTLEPVLEHGQRGLAPLQRLMAEVKGIIEPYERPGVTFHFAGPAALNIALQEAMRRDLAMFGPLSAVALLLLLWWVLRSVMLTAVGFAAAAMALIWSLGLLALLDVPMSIGLSMIVPLVLSMALVYTVHYLVCFSRGSPDHGDGDSIQTCCLDLVIPSLLCGLTTVVGFVSLGSSPLPGIRDVGLYVGFGILVCTWVANVFVPALFSRWSLLRIPASPRAGRNDSIGRIVERLRGLTMKHPARFVLAVLILTALAAGGLFRLQVETNHLEYLRNDRHFTESFGFVDRHFGGVLPLEILMHVPENKAAAALLRAVAAEEALRALPGLGSVQSVADLVLEAEARTPRHMAALPRIELKSGILPGQIWTLLEESAIGGSLLRRSDSGLTLRIACRAHIAGSGRLRAVLSEVDQIVQRELSVYHPVVTGLTKYFSGVERYVVTTQIRSFALALLVTVILLGLLSGSWQAGIAVVAVNVIPVILVLGAMGWSAVPLDIATVMIASIALGMVVDDTLHLLYRYRVAMRHGHSADRSLNIAFKEVGTPITAATFILFAGFVVLVPARFVPTSYFGGLSALTVMVAAMADLLLLPALLSVLPHRTVKDG